MSNFFLILALIIGFHAHGGTEGKGCLNDNFKSPELSTTKFGDFYFMKSGRQKISNIEGENWHPITQWGGDYFISNFIRVKRNGKEIIPYINNMGYYTIGLSCYGSVKHFLFHRLIALNFIPNPLLLPFINHKNGIKTDNRIENLEWCTASENIKHAYRELGAKKSNLGKFLGDSANSLSVIQESKAGIFIAQYSCAKEAEQKTGINRCGISMCANGKRKTAGKCIWKFNTIQK